VPLGNAASDRFPQLRTSAIESFDGPLRVERARQPPADSVEKLRSSAGSKNLSLVKDANPLGREGPHGSAEISLVRSTVLQADTAHRILAANALRRKLHRCRVSSFFNRIGPETVIQSAKALPGCARSIGDHDG
jgi:hypothetical protein